MTRVARNICLALDVFYTYILITTLRKFSKKYFHSPKYLRTATNTVDHGIVPTLPSSGADGADADRPDVGSAHADVEGVNDAFRRDAGVTGADAGRPCVDALMP